MAVGDNWKVVVCCYTPTQISLNNFYLQTLSEGANPPTAAAVAEAVDAVMAPLYKPWMSSLASYRGVAASKVAIPLPAPVAAISRDGPGTGTAFLAPTQTSGLISFKTGFAGNHYRGRVFPGLPDNNFVTATGALSAGGLAVLVPLASAYLTLFSAVDIVAPFGAGVLALTVRNAFQTDPPVDPPVFTIGYERVVATFARSRFATQRRRGQFGRTNVLPF